MKAANQIPPNEQATRLLRWLPVGLVVKMRN